MEIGLSVARYREPCGWVRRFGARAQVADKGPGGEGLGDVGAARVRALPNVGKDQHSHLDYIVRNYDALPDVVVFMQGQSIDHPDAVQQPGVPGVDDAAAAARAAERRPESELDMVAYLVEDCLASPYGTSRPGRLFRGTGIGAVPGFKISRAYPGERDSGYTFGEWVERFVGPWPRGAPDVPWFKNAIFAARRERILSRPRAFYEALMAQLDASNCEATHYVERAWWLALTSGGHGHGPAPRTCTSAAPPTTP